MYIYVCMLYMYAWYNHVYAYVCMCVHVYMGLCVYMYVCICMYIYITSLCSQCYACGILLLYIIFVYI